MSTLFRPATRDDKGLVIPPGHKMCRNSRGQGCGRVKPLTKEYFYTSHYSVDGFQHRCKLCDRVVRNARALTEEGREARRRYLRGEARKAAVKRRRANEQFKRQQAEYHASPRGQLIGTARRMECESRHAKGKAKKRHFRTIAKLYRACVEALDPADGVPVPTGAKRCPKCQVPRPLKGGFYKQRGSPDGFTRECRRCLRAAAGSPVRDREKAFRNSTEFRVLKSLADAERRLSGPQKPSHRAMTERTVAACRAELARIEGRGQPSYQKGG